jgi:hypothetical protein
VGTLDESLLNILVLNQDFKDFEELGKCLWFGFFGHFNFNPLNPDSKLQITRTICYSGFKICVCIIPQFKKTSKVPITYS